MLRSFDVARFLFASWFQREQYSHEQNAKVGHSRFNPPKHSQSARRFSSPSLRLKAVSNLDTAAREAPRRTHGGRLRAAQLYGIAFEIFQELRLAVFVEDSGGRDTRFWKHWHNALENAFAPNNLTQFLNTICRASARGTKRSKCAAKNKFTRSQPLTGGSRQSYTAWYARHVQEGDATLAR